MIKNALKASLACSKSKNIEYLLQRFLFDYRATKHTTTAESPAKIMLNREIKTRFNLLHSPSINENIVKCQNRQIRNYKGAGNRMFGVEDSVIVRKYSDPNKKT